MNAYSLIMVSRQSTVPMAAPRFTEMAVSGAGVRLRAHFDRERQRW